MTHNLQKLQKWYHEDDDISPLVMSDRGERRHCELPVQKVFILVSLDEDKSRQYFEAYALKCTETSMSKVTK